MMLFCRDRAYLDRELLPAVGSCGGKALFIGCQRYTRRYPSVLTAHGAECWTIDIDPTVARWGAPKRHTIGDIRDGSDHWLPASFDTIILNGVFGFGLDCVRDQDEALRACRLLLFFKPHRSVIQGLPTGFSTETVETLQDNYSAAPLLFTGGPLPDSDPRSLGHGYPGSQSLPSPADYLSAAATRRSSGADRCRPP